MDTEKSGVDDGKQTSESDTSFESTIMNPDLTYPIFRLIRGEQTYVETIQFTPKSLMTIRVEGTGITKMTTVLMRDHMGQIRYKSSSGGEIHEYVTRLQNTRSYGRWKITIAGILPDEERSFEIEIPFFVVKKIDETLDEPIYEPHTVEEFTPDIRQEEKHSGDGDETVLEDPTKSSLLDEVLKDEIKLTKNHYPEMKISKSNEKTVGIKKSTEENQDETTQTQEDVDQDKNELEGHNISRHTEENEKIDGRLDFEDYDEVEDDYPSNINNKAMHDDLDDEDIAKGDNKEKETNIWDLSEQRDGKQFDMEDEPIRGNEGIESKGQNDDLVKGVSDDNTVESNQVKSKETDNSILKTIENTINDQLSNKTQDEEYTASTNETKMESSNTETVDVQNQNIEPLEVNKEEPKEKQDSDNLTNDQAVTEQAIKETQEALDEIIKEIGSSKIEKIKTLTIPLDELNIIEDEDLNHLNSLGIFYIHDFLNQSIEYLVESTSLNPNEVGEINDQSKDIILNDQNQVSIKYHKLGEMIDKSLHYSTIPVIELESVGETIHGKFVEASITSISDLANISIKNLTKSTGFTVKKSIEYITEAQELVFRRVNVIDYNFDKFYPNMKLGTISRSSQLDKIHGIEIETLNELYGIGINNLEKLGNADLIKLSGLIRKPIHEIIPWIFEAQIFVRNRVSVQYRAN